MNEGSYEERLKLNIGTIRVCKTTLDSFMQQKIKGKINKKYNIMKWIQNNDLYVEYDFAKKKQKVKVR